MTQQELPRTEAGYAEVNGTRLYYEVAGSGPAVAPVQGFGLDTRMWDDQFLPFARDHRVVRYDARLRALRRPGWLALPSGGRPEGAAGAPGHR